MTYLTGSALLGGRARVHRVRGGAMAAVAAELRATPKAVLAEHVPKHAIIKHVTKKELEKAIMHQVRHRK
jgi:hypothetical protein